MNALVVTNTALLRYIGHRDGFDVEELRAVLCASLGRAHNAALLTGETDYLVKRDGLLFVIRDDKVITVTLEAGPVTAAATLRNGRA